MSESPTSRFLTAVGLTALAGVICIEGGAEVGRIIAEEAWPNDPFAKQSSIFVGRVSGLFGTFLFALTLMFSKRP